MAKKENGSTPLPQRLSISFSGEAAEGFSDRIEQMAHWYVRITPQRGEAFDAVLLGSALDVEIDGDYWFDAVHYVAADEDGLALPNAPRQTVRVIDVYVY